MVPWGGPCRGRAPNVLLPLGGRYLGPLLMLMSQKREMKGCLPHMVSLSSLSCLPELRVPVCSEGSICPPPRPGAASPSGQFLLGVDSLPPFPLSDNLIASHITPSTSRPLEVTTHTLPKAEPSGALVLTENPGLQPSCGLGPHIPTWEGKELQRGWVWGYQGWVAGKWEGKGGPQDDSVVGALPSCLPGARRVLP